ncbi:hypothetical protein GH714_034843 [Hevea brasiliensis]|uniref:non-specific serine/threonine protein kinase n=1 Tax=Hevea brasiliensis TaxID=3981 RepID=A0A6A6NE70_HEVBR|nr:hypothetical protein GH714_034843 [Hevea brasiliensis]
MDQDGAVDVDASPRAPLPKLKSVINGGSSSSLSYPRKTEGRRREEADVDRQTILASCDFDSLNSDGGPGPKKCQYSFPFLIRMLIVPLGSLWVNFDYQMRKSLEILNSMKMGRMMMLLKISPGPVKKKKIQGSFDVVKESDDDEIVEDGANAVVQVEDIEIVEDALFELKQGCDIEKNAILLKSEDELVIPNCSKGFNLASTQLLRVNLANDGLPATKIGFNKQDPFRASLLFGFMPKIASLLAYAQNGAGEAFAKQVEDGHKASCPWEVPCCVSTDILGLLQFQLLPTIAASVVKQMWIADFGLAKDPSDSTSHISTEPKGTFGYFAPECFNNRRLTDKSDVFSFGIVLLELITGKPAVDDEGNDRINLADWARPRLKQALYRGKYSVLVDSKLQKAYNKKDLARMTCCAAACVYKPANFRPKMSQIVEVLQGNMVRKRIWRRTDKKFLYDGSPYSSLPEGSSYSSYKGLISHCWGAY